MKTVKLLLLLLLPAALFFASCQNELPPETFLMEENFYLGSYDQYYHLSDVDYFELSLNKLNLAKLGQPNISPDESLQPDIRLERGDILRLEGLKPGYYRIIGRAYKINDNYDPTLLSDPDYIPLTTDFPFYRVGTVEGKSDRMYYCGQNRTNYIIVEAGVPVIVRFIFTGDYDNL